MAANDAVKIQLIVDNVEIVSSPIFEEYDILVWERERNLTAFYARGISNKKRASQYAHEILDTLVQVDEFDILGEIPGDPFASRENLFKDFLNEE